MTAATSLIGDNSRHAPPLEIIGERINDLCEAAAHWLDGTPIADDDQARDVAQLVADLRTASTEADKAREADKAPHLAAGRAVDAAWKPLIDKAARAKNAALAASAAWLTKQENARLERERIAREEARQADIAARAALAVAEATDLAALETAEAAVTHAKELREAVREVATERTVAKGYGDARAIGLRTVWTATVTDRRAALNHYARTRPDDLTDWIQEMADRDARGARPAIPGVEYVGKQVAR